MNTSQSPETAPGLTSSQKKKLRSLAHHLEPMVYVGKEGLSKPLQQSATAALKAHELIKIKLGRNCPLERGAAGEQLARICEATLVQIIGRMVLLYRPNPDLPPAKRIVW
ncbi:MAG: ribosome assembly RNA-binding protein YhbY [Desulfobulbus sp.]